MRIIVYCDSSIKRSIGCTTAVVIKNDKDTLFEFTETVSLNNLSNGSNIVIGELSAILLALKKLIELDLTNNNICIYSDSLNAVNLINANEQLYRLEEIYLLKSNFYNIKIEWLPKNKTKEAHRLCYGVTRLKTQERRYMQTKVKHKQDSIFLVQGKGNTKLYEVDISRRSCTCIHFKKGKQCKHIMAAIYKSEKVISGEIVDHFIEG